MLPALQPCHRLCMPVAGALQHLEASDLLMPEALCLMWLAITQLHDFAQIKPRTTTACKPSDEVLAASSSQCPGSLADRCSRSAVEQLPRAGLKPIEGFGQKGEPSVPVSPLLQNKLIYRMLAKVEQVMHESMRSFGAVFHPADLVQGRAGWGYRHT